MVRRALAKLPRPALVVLGATAGLAFLLPSGGTPVRSVIARAAERPARLQPRDDAPMTPSVFAAVSSGAGSGLSLELRSVATGGVVDVLGRLGLSWTDNGLALSPDGRYVYFTLVPKRGIPQSLLLEQLSVSDNRQRLFARGEQPAVSPGGLLAYASGEDRTAAVVVANPASGRRRSINIARLLGSQSDLLNASLAWLGDGTRIAVFEACCPIAVSRASARAGRVGSASVGSALHLIVVSVPRHGKLRARQVTLPPGTAMPETLGTDATAPDSLLAASLIGDDRAAVERVTISPSRTTVIRLLTIPHALVVAFDPSGRGLLYLEGHSPPDLWSATLEGAQLSARQLLIGNPPLQAYAW